VLVFADERLKPAGVAHALNGSRTVRHQVANPAGRGKFQRIGGPGVWCSPDAWATPGVSPASLEAAQVLTDQAIVRLDRKGEAELLFRFFYLAGLGQRGPKV